MNVIIGLTWPNVPGFLLVPAWVSWLILAVTGIFGSMLFSGLETGLYTLSRPRLDIRCWKNQPAALRIAHWLKRPAGVLAGLLIWQNLCNFAVSAAVASLLRQRQVSSFTETLLSAAVVLPLLLIFGEIIPKDLFLTHADRWTYRMVPTLRWALATITIVPLLPLMMALDAVTRRIFHRPPEVAVGALPKLMAMAEESIAHGFLSDTQHDLIQRGMRLAQVKVGQVMTSWNRVIGVPATIGRAGFTALLRRYNVSRLPVLGRSTQDVLGIVHLVDVLAEAGEWNLRSRLQPAMTLLDEQSVRSAIKLMQAAQRTIALVVSRQGKVIGLVTMKDLVEELLGNQATDMLLEKILTQARRRGSETAIFDDRGSLSFRRLTLGADIMAGHINRWARAEDKIGLLLPQCSAFAVAFLGTRWTGRIVVPLNYLLRPAELLAVCRDAGLKTVFTIRYFQEHAAALREAGLRVILMEDVSFSAPGTILARLVGIPRRLRPRQPDDVAVILYTSGTSGEPKGVMLTNRNLDSNAAAAIEHARFNQQMTFLGILPMFHTLGLMGCFLVPLSLGCRVVYQARCSPVAVFEAVARHQIQVLIAVPTMYALMANAKSARRQSLAGVQYAISGGEPLSLSLIEQFRDKFGLTLLEGFGLTETSPMVSFSVPWAHKLGSVGKPLREVELRIVDEQDRPLGPNQDGELWIKGPNVMKGYYHNPAATAAVINGAGWLKTGDIARVDEDGFLYITGRKKEMIIMGGEKITPGEIEEVLRQYPGVLLAAVIGAKDPQRGECPVAFLQMEPDLKEKPAAQDIRAFVRRRLAPYKTPRDIYFVEAMPRSPTGKILKRALSIPLT